MTVSNIQSADKTDAAPAAEKVHNATAPPARRPPASRGDDALVAGAVPVPYASSEHVRHSLEAAVRMIGEAGDVFLRIIRAEGVEQQKRVETALQIVGEDARELDTRAVGRSLPGHLAFDLSRATDRG